MIETPFIAHSELTNEIYIVVGKEKYCVTEQAIKAVMAIKALEQEPTTKNDLGVDCISRQDVLSEIIRFSTEEGSSVECQQLYCDVNNMPSSTPQEPRWIPVSERLPEENGNYIVTCNSSDGSQSIQFQMVEHYGPDWLHQTKSRKVLAWMPLPEPYKADQEGT